MESEACQYCGRSGTHSSECPTLSKEEKEALSLAENAENVKNRILSDAEKITGKHYEADDDFFDDPARGGAKYVTDKGAQRPRLEFTEEQVKDAREDMETAERLRKEAEERRNRPEEKKSFWGLWRSKK